MPDWVPDIEAVDPIDPSDVLDYQFDFAPFLGGDSASSIGATAKGITIDSNTVSGSMITVWLSNGVPGAKAVVEFTCVSAAGRTIQRSIRIPVNEL